MIFSGPYPSPTVLTIPGTVDDRPASPNRVVWGEDIVISVPDPGENCTLLLAIKSEPSDVQGIVEISYERTADEGDISFRVSGPRAKKLMAPSVLFYQLIKVIDPGMAPLRYSPLSQGTLELVETAASSFVPEEDTEPGEFPGQQSAYPPIEMILNGSVSVGQIFGFFRVPAGTTLKLSRVDIIAQTPPTGSALVLRVVDGDGANLSGAITLPSGESILESVLNPVLTLEAGSVVRMKVISTNTDNPGENLEVRLKLSLA